MYTACVPPQKTSPWLTRIPDVARYPKLSGDLTTEVVVVGGGIAGITTAYFLTKAGKRVTLIEGNHLGTGETGFTTAFLIAAVDPPLARVRERFGDDHMRTVWQTGAETIDLVEATVRDESLDCGFHRLDAFEVAFRAEDMPHVEEECAAIQIAGGRPSLLKEEQIRAALGIPAAGGVQIPQQGAFDVRAFLLGLAELIFAAGGQIFEETRMTGLDLGPSLQVKTGSGTITTAHVVLATGLFPAAYRVQNKLFRPMVTYVIALGFPGSVPTSDVSPSTSDVGTAHAWQLPDALYSDFGEPFHYMRFLYPELSRGVDGLFFIGGEDRSVQDAAKAGETPWAALEAFARTAVPDRGWDVTHAWRGQILETEDAFPVVGVPPGGDPRVLLVSGFGGNGMTLGTRGGKVAAELIAGQRTPEENPFRFERETLRERPVETAQ